MEQEYQQIHIQEYMHLLKKHRFFILGCAVFALAVGIIAMGITVQKTSYRTSVSIQTGRITPLISHTNEQNPHTDFTSLTENIALASVLSLFNSSQLKQLLEENGYETGQILRSKPKIPSLAKWARTLTAGEIMIDVSIDENVENIEIAVTSPHEKKSYDLALLLKDAVFTAYKEHYTIEKQSIEEEKRRLEEQADSKALEFARVVELISELRPYNLDARAIALAALLPYKISLESDLNYIRRNIKAYESIVYLSPSSTDEKVVNELSQNFSFMQRILTGFALFMVGGFLGFCIVLVKQWPQTHEKR